MVTDGYLQAMGIPLRAGRGLIAQDTATSQPVALVNETTARTLWPGRNPLGQILMADGSQDLAGAW